MRADIDRAPLGLFSLSPPAPRSPYCIYAHGLPGSVTAMACTAAALPPWLARSSLQKTMATRGVGRRGRLWSFPGSGGGGSAVVAPRRPWTRRLLVAKVETGTGSVEQGLEELGLTDDMQRESVHGFVVVPEESKQTATHAHVSHFGVSWKEVGASRKKKPRKERRK